VPVLAAAAGTVVAAVDDMPDQIPGPPQGVTVENAPGNHVIQDIGGGRWVLYAHLSPGSVTVKPGDVLRPGQPLGKLGNSGSSTAPHLHFQVMDRPSALNAVGLPFVFDRQWLEGVVVNTPAQAELEYEAGRRLGIDRRPAELRHGEMPAEGHLLGFHLD
jgi:murein DD-endopeptidase MepM/ murein hydrolase activator NlpD